MTIAESLGATAVLGKQAPGIHTPRKQCKVAELGERIQVYRPVVLHPKTTKLKTAIRPCGAVDGAANTGVDGGWLVRRRAVDGSAGGGATAVGRASDRNSRRQPRGGVCLALRRGGGRAAGRRRAAADDAGDLAERAGGADGELQFRGASKMAMFRAQAAIRFSHPRRS
jgi:hypothetical protein